MAVEINVVYDGGMACTAVHTPSGATIITDAPVDNGGRGAAFSPTDLVATGVATCVLTIMDKVAVRHGLDLKGTKVRVLKHMVADPDRRIGHLEVFVDFAATAVAPEMRTRLEAAAQSCPVKKSLHPSVQVTLTFHYPA